MKENPFERYGIDPREGPRGITERMRELAEDAPEAEKGAIRAAWEELTLHPARRLLAALGAHPETRPPLGAPPPMRNRRAEGFQLSLADLVPRPSVASALGPPSKAQVAVPSSSSPSIDDDPLLLSPKPRERNVR